MFTLGEKPELRYKAAREALAQMGYATTLDYLHAAAKAVLDETGLLPHANPGTMTDAEIALAAWRLAVDGHHAGVGIAAAQRKRHAALRFARQDP